MIYGANWRGTIGIVNPTRGTGSDFDDTTIVSRYFKEAGLSPQAMLKLPGRWEDIGTLSSHAIYSLIKQLFLAHRKDVQGIYLQGSKMRCLDVVDLLEQDLG